MTQTPRALIRSYSSFDVNKTSEFGPGWSMMPATLSNEGPGASIYCGTNVVFTGPYPYKISFTSAAGRETFTFNCGVGYVPDSPIFHSKISRDVNGYFVVTTKDRLTYAFRGTG